MYFLKKNKRGILNKYKKGTPFPKVILEDLRNGLKEIYFFLKNGFKNQTILTYPHLPSKKSLIHRFGKKLNYTLTNKIREKHDVIIYWEYLTFREEFKLLEELNKKQKVINLLNRDISKKYVDSIFKKIFGYGTEVDPLTFNGLVVKKNDINAKHDGTIIQCPISKKEENFIYQLLINNNFDKRTVEDIRVPVFIDHIPFVYLKYRDVKERFKNSTVRTLIKKPEEVLSAEEIEKIVLFCKNSNLEYGELDVLRNRDDQKIYIVDVNNTPHGPPTNLTKKDRKYAIETLSASFKKTFITA